MGHPLEHMRKVESEVHVPVASAQLVQLHADEPLDLVIFDRDAYWLDLCLGARPRNARASYLDHWAPQRFERLGNIYLLPPGETVQTRSDGACAHESIFCHLHPEPMQKWFDGELKWTSRRLEASLDIVDSSIRYLLCKLAEEMRHPRFASEMLVELIAAQLMIELGRYFGDFDKIPSTGALASWRLQLIDDRLREVREVPSLDELAMLCDLSVRQLTRGFRASRGCSIGEHVEKSRADHAKQLLAGDQSIKAIAYSLGFPSPSGFCFAFRRATGMTPGEFRASHTTSKARS